MKEFWIEQDDNELLSVYRFHPGNAHQLFHVIEFSSYQSLQEKYEKAVSALKCIERSYPTSVERMGHQEYALRIIKELGEL